MPMENLSRMAAPGRLLLASAALCAAQAGDASDKGAINIGALVLGSTQCRIDTAGGSRCLGSAATPRVSTTFPAPASRARYAGHLVMKMTAVAVSFDSRGTAAPAAEPVVLTISP
jgi:hypothetical protein